MAAVTLKMLEPSSQECDQEEGPLLVSRSLAVVPSRYDERTIEGRGKALYAENLVRIQIKTSSNSDSISFRLNAIKTG